MPETRYQIGGKRISRHESRMIARGIAAGYQAGRHGRKQPCPYPDDGRPRALWLAGHAKGEQDGAAERERVRESYEAGLEALDAGAPNCWS